MPDFRLIRLRPAVAGLRRAGPPSHDGSGEAGVAINRFDGTIVGQQLIADR